MATITKRVLSASTQGQVIDVSTTLSKTIHTCSTASDTIDEVWVWAMQLGSQTTSVNIKINNPGTSSESWAVRIPPAGGDPVLVCPGLLMQAQESAAITLGMAGVTATTSLLVTGYVNRIDQS